MLYCGVITSKGNVTGEVSAPCKEIIPQLTKLGIRSELWLAQDNSLESARALFKKPEAFAQKLISIAEATPGLQGFNLDFEGEVNATQADVADFAAFLKTATHKLNSNSAKSGYLRFSADVTCGSGSWNALSNNCVVLGKSGVNKLMNMQTYHADSWEQWLTLFQWSTKPAIPRSVIAAGLQSSRGSIMSAWDKTAEAAEKRICALMNYSFAEIGMYELQQGIQPPGINYPLEFWIPQLEKYITGEGCNLDLRS
jgi:hypothetical protein